MKLYLNTASPYDAAEHALDSSALSVEEGRVAVLPAAVELWRDVRHRAFALALAADAVDVIALIAIEDSGIGHLLQKETSARAISD